MVATGDVKVARIFWDIKKKSRKDICRSLKKLTGKTALNLEWISLELWKGAKVKTSAKPTQIQHMPWGQKGAQI